MKFHTALRAGGATLLFAGSMTNANACEIWRDEFTKVWRGNCNLTIDPKAPRIVQHFIDGVLPPIRLKMPDLEIRRFRYEVNGNEVNVQAYVRNIGDQTSFATTVGVTVTTVGVSNSVTQTTILPVHPVPSLPAMTETLISMGYVYVDNSTQDVDLVTAGMVDQVTVAQPVRGNVIESNETNNAKMELCRVFGPNPMPVVPRC